MSKVLFLESFLLFCLLEDSKFISSVEQVEIDNNNNLVAHDGNNKELILTKDNQAILATDFYNKILKKIKKYAAAITVEHEKAVISIINKANNNLTPSKLILQGMSENKKCFNIFINNLAKKKYQYFKHKKINQEHFIMFKKAAIISKRKQQCIEKNNKISFDKYLINYFSQL